MAAPTLDSKWVARAHIPLYLLIGDVAGPPPGYRRCVCPSTGISVMWLPLHQGIGDVAAHSGSSLKTETSHDGPPQRAEARHGGLLQRSESGHLRPSPPFQVGHVWSLSSSVLWTHVGFCRSGSRRKTPESADVEEPARRGSEILMRFLVCKKKVQNHEKLLRTSANPFTLGVHCKGAH